MGKHLAVLLMLILSFAEGRTLAQEEATCAAIVQRALAATGEVCAAAGRNQACYGNLRLVADPQPGVVDLKFSEKGDIADVVKISRLQLSAFDERRQEWGVSLMRLQANLPNTLPGQNVTVLLFGNVEMWPADVPVQMPVHLSGESVVNVRGGPSTAAPVVAALPSGARVIANGRNSDGSWVRVLLDDGRAGWVFADLVTVEGETAALHPIQADEPTFGLMQAFYLKTGVGDAPCAEAPDSGILIQTPDGAGHVEFRINEVNITLGSTVYVQAGDNLRISVIEGQAEVTAAGESVVAPAGTRVEVALDANAQAEGPPSEPAPYEAEEVQVLPVQLLPREIEVAAPLSVEQVSALSACTVTAVSTVNLRSGPGVVYSRAGGLLAGDSAAPVGQAMGTDRFIWWKLPDNTWVRSDVVEPTGDCDAVQIVTEVPPVPTPIPGGSTGSLQVVYLSGGCSPSIVKAGTVTLAMGNARAEWLTCEAVFAEVSQLGHASFSGNGPAPGNFRYESFCHPDPNSDGMGTNSMADVQLTPGVYTYTGTWGYTVTCTFTVVP